MNVDFGVGGRDLNLAEFADDARASASQSAGPARRPLFPRVGAPASCPRASGCRGNPASFQWDDRDPAGELANRKGEELNENRFHALMASGCSSCAQLS